MTNGNFLPDKGSGDEFHRPEDNSDNTEVYQAPQQPGDGVGGPVENADELLEAELDKELHASYLFEARNEAAATVDKLLVPIMETTANLGTLELIDAAIGQTVVLLASADRLSASETEGITDIDLGALLYEKQDGNTTLDRVKSYRKRLTGIAGASSIDFARVYLVEGAVYGSDEALEALNYLLADEAWAIKSERALNPNYELDSSMYGALGAVIETCEYLGLSYETWMHYADMETAWEVMVEHYKKGDPKDSRVTEQIESKAWELIMGDGGNESSFSEQFIHKHTLSVLPACKTPHLRFMLVDRFLEAGEGISGNPPEDLETLAEIALEFLQEADSEMVGVLDERITRLWRQITIDTKKGESEELAAEAMFRWNQAARIKKGSLSNPNDLLQNIREFEEDTEIMPQWNKLILTGIDQFLAREDWKSIGYLLRKGGLARVDEIYVDLWGRATTLDQLNELRPTHESTANIALQRHFEIAQVIVGGDTASLKGEAYQLLEALQAARAPQSSDIIPPIGPQLQWRQIEQILDRLKADQAVELSRNILELCDTLGLPFLTNADLRPVYSRLFQIGRMRDYKLVETAILNRTDEASTVKIVRLAEHALALR